MKDEIVCSATVFSPRVHSWGCCRRGVVERKGKWYCKQHDPEAIKAKRAAASKKYRDERAAEDAIVREGELIAQRLGCGEVQWNRGPSRQLVISFEDAERLAALKSSR